MKEVESDSTLSLEHKEKRGSYMFSRSWVGEMQETNPHRYIP